jgi:nucleoid DNA-binding protein
MPKKNIQIGELMRELGFHALICPKCGTKMNATKAARAIFELIMIKCREHAKDGVGVTIHGFGMFKSKWLEGREIKTPLDGVVKSKGKFVMRFKSAQSVKRRLNE